ncbi:MAG: integrase, partial [Lachnospiraceae bacterium]|nr:integrase [Lachnospiraceae bacterium]
MPVDSQSYHRQVDQKNIIKLRELIEDLPSYVKDFFRGIDSQTSSRTRIAYAYDLRVFYRYLHENNPELGRKEIKDISLEDLQS